LVDAAVVAKHRCSMSSQKGALSNLHGGRARAAGVALLVMSSLMACTSKPLSEDTSDEGSGMEESPSLEIVTVFEATRVSSRADAEHYQRTETLVDFGVASVSRAVLRVELESPCFPFEKWSADAIPAGHNWPRLCDAFDRLLVVSLDPPEPPATAPPALEVARAVTPFGGPATFETDVTDLVNGLPGTHRLRIDIGTWGDASGMVSGSEGEWIVRAVLTLEHGAAPRRVLSIVPLVASVQTVARGAAAVFDVPEGASSGRIEYFATGHGGAALEPGCGGPAEEFCRRTHTLFLDGAAADEFSPWRNDCAGFCTLTRYSGSDLLTAFDYCLENPCGAVASVRAPRANWCPGTAVLPYAVQGVMALTPGEHEFRADVNAIAEGGQWMIGATYFAYE
jgi:hypothetical protein